MPKMDGFEATRLIKKNRPNLPVIAQTAYALSNDKKQALEAGCDNYISKPINKVNFMEVISSYLS
jgi:CheY-like chemotaxis protein